jgi:hypothetical protein
MAVSDRPWVILITRHDKLGEPIVGVPRDRSQACAHKANRLLRFATREDAERHLRISVDKHANRCYTVTTL